MHFRSINGFKKSTLQKFNDEKIDFVVVNGENAADSGVGLTEEICKDLFNCGVDVV